MVKISRDAYERILLLYRTGQYCLSDIANELNESGFKTPKGKPYYAMTIKRILDEARTAKESGDLH